MSKTIPSKQIRAKHLINSLLNESSEPKNPLPKVLYHNVNSDSTRDFVLQNGIKADDKNMVYLSTQPITKGLYKYSFKVTVPDENKLWDWKDIWSDSDDKEYDAENPYYVYEGDIDKQNIKLLNNSNSTLKESKKILKEAEEETSSKEAFKLLDSARQSIQDAQANIYIQMPNQIQQLYKDDLAKIYQHCHNAIAEVQLLAKKIHETLDV